MCITYDKCHHRDQLKAYRSQRIPVKCAFKLIRILQCRKLLKRVNHLLYEIQLVATINVNVPFAYKQSGGDHIKGLLTL